MTAADLPPPPPALTAVARVGDQAAGDPLRDSQRHLGQIGWTPPRRGERMPIVAVLDTGVDPSDPDLAGVVMTRQARSFVPGSPDPLTDPEGHGTHVAGIIAARTGNGAGGSGVAAARILPITIADAGGATTTSALVRGIRYAVARGARVVNISFGGRGRSRLEQEAIDAATRRGVLVVAAAGNAGGRGGAPDYPGAYRHVMAVGALGASGRALAISARGEQVAIAAPGEEVRSLEPGQPGRLAPRTGTSMAAAVASGAAARLLARRPGLSAQQVRAILEWTARDVPPTGPDVATGAGALDLRAALAARPPAKGDAEPNDEIALAARTRPLLPATAARARLRGRAGSWSDPRDHLRLVLAEGQTITATLTARGARGAPAPDLDLLLWRPGTPSGRRGPAISRNWLVASSLGPTARERLVARAPSAGVYSLEVRGVRGAAEYDLRVERAVTVAGAGVRGPGARGNMEMR
ncbi:S8 family serine peptidase [Miltoncostaea marina]|uniref:S8 family serine peptidase n=1 Tax=Miltoncostaea marina TaxID=2843215 RepID=UPI001C3D89F3|nr:S8 family serine peptidase [Miltoncostaea marina]